jgi:hypothetical protein
MLTGAHCIIYSTNPDADRIFLRDVVKFQSVDAGNGWLIFGLPPAEIAIHPSEKNNIHEFYLICDDVALFVKDMKKHKIKCSPVKDQDWGLLTQLSLPVGGKLGVYQPKHARPETLNPIKSLKNSLKHSRK